MGYFAVSVVSAVGTGSPVSEPRKSTRSAISAVDRSTAVTSVVVAPSAVSLAPASPVGLPTVVY